MCYPIEFAHSHMEFVSGRSDKFYALTLLVNADGKSAVIRRFGRNGSFGELSVDNFDTQAKGEKLYEKLLKEKTGKGYNITKGDTATVRDNADLRMKIGVAVWPKLPPSLINHLSLDVPTNGRKELDPPRFSEDGKFKGEPKPRVFSQEELDALRAKEAEEAKREAQQTYSNNPIYGRF